MFARVKSIRLENTKGERYMYRVRNLDNRFSFDNLQVNKLVHSDVHAKYVKTAETPSSG